MIIKRKHIPCRDEAYLHTRFTIDCNGCWNWIGFVDIDGYGRAKLADGSLKLAHRLSYEVFNGPILDGLYVLHSCDNTRCIRPKHLFTGTQLDNMRDMLIKGRGRWVRGENHPKSTLTSDQVMAIFQDSHSQASIAVSYGISPSTVNGIKSGRTWSSITGYNQ